MLSADDFVWDGHFWVAPLQLQDRRLAEQPVELTFAPEGRGEGPLTNREMTLIQTAMETVNETAAASVSAIFAEYPNLRDAYGYEPDEQAQYMPDLSSIGELYGLIDVTAVAVHQIDRSGQPYVGFEFSCAWDPEHGTGVLMNGPRVVDIGGAATAFLLWIAEADRNNSQTD